MAMRICITDSGGTDPSSLATAQAAREWGLVLAQWLGSSSTSCFLPTCHPFFQCPNLHTDPGHHSDLGKLSGRDFFSYKKECSLKEDATTKMSVLLSSPHTSISNHSDSDRTQKKLDNRSIKKLWSCCNLVSVRQMGRRLTRGTQQVSGAGPTLLLIGVGTT